MPTVDDVFAALVAYEVFALAGRRLPTITVLCQRDRRLAPLVLAVVGAHLVLSRR